eukprot:5466975-Pyramimonas_sp.AAC.1
MGKGEGRTMIDEEERKEEALALMFVLRCRASVRAAADSSEGASGCASRRCQPSKIPYLLSVIAEREC